MAFKAFITAVLATMLCAGAVAQDRSKSTYIIAGNVQLADGRPVPEPVEVLLICSGTVSQRVHSQAGGQFSFTLANNKSPITGLDETAGSPSGGGFRTFNQIGRGFGDSGAHGSGRSSKFGRMYLGDCEIVASLPGFTSDVLYPGTRDVLENPNVGTIKLHRRTGIYGTTVSMNSLNAPEKARKAYESARSILSGKRKDYSRAARELRKAVDAYPEYAVAWRYLGECHTALGEPARARESFEKAIAADPAYLHPYVMIAELDLQGGRAEDAARWSARALELNPDWIRASYVNAWAHVSLGNVDAAEESVRKVQGSTEAAAYPRTHYLLGGILAAKGDFPAAAEEFRRFLELTPDFEGAGPLKKQLAAWEDQGMIPKGRPQPD